MPPHDGEPLSVLFPRGEPDFGDRSIHEGTEVGQAAAEDGAGVAADPDRAPLQRVKREERGVQLVAKLVSGLLGALDFLVRSLLCGQPGMLGDRFGNGRIERAVQGVELLAAARRRLRRVHRPRRRWSIPSSSSRPMSQPA